MAPTARIRPKMLSMSTRCTGLADDERGASASRLTPPVLLSARSASSAGWAMASPILELGAQAGHRLAVELADAGFAHLEHRRDLLEVEFLLVVQPHEQLLALGQVLDGLDEGGAEFLVVE